MVIKYKAGEDPNANVQKQDSQTTASSNVEGISTETTPATGQVLSPEEQQKFNEFQNKKAELEAIDAKKKANEGIDLSGFGQLGEEAKQVGTTPQDKTNAPQEPRSTDIQSTGTPIQTTQIAGAMTPEQITAYFAAQAGAAAPQTPKEWLDEQQKIQDTAPTTKRTFETPNGTKVDENGNVISTPDDQKKADALMEYYGIDNFKFDSRQDTYSFIQDLYGSLYRSLGLPSLEDEIKEANKSLEDFKNETADMVSAIEDNPWVDAGSKQQRINKLLEKRAIRENNLLGRLTRASDLQERGRAEARFVTSTALNAYYKDREFQAGLMQDAMDRAERAQGAPFTLSQGQVRYDADGNIIAIGQGAGGESLNLSATEIKDTREKLEAENELITLAKKYRNLIEEHGYTNAIFGNKTVKGQVLTLRGQLTAAYKDARKLGTLDEGVLTLMEQILGPNPVTPIPGVNVFGGRSEQIVSSINELLDTTIAAQERDMTKLGLLPGGNEEKTTKTWTSEAGVDFVLPN